MQRKQSVDDSSVGDLSRSSSIRSILKKDTRGQIILKTFKKITKSTIKVLKTFTLNSIIYENITKKEDDCL